MEAELWAFRVEEGLGNACALIFPDGSGGVVDWGTQRREPLDLLITLLQRSIRPRLRFVTATHPHEDHCLGLEGLLIRAIESGITIDRLLYPTPIAGSPNNFLRAARLRAKELGIQMSSVALTTLPESPPAPVIALGVTAPGEPRWFVQVLGPTDTAIGDEEVMSERGGRTPGNRSSLVLRFSFYDANGSMVRGRAILPGDATPATLNLARKRSIQFPELSLDNDAIVIPHHGSSHNWVPWFEGSLQGVAIVSAPSGRVKHPAPDTLQQVTRICGHGPDSQLYCTSYAGACHTAFGKGVQGAPARLDPCFGSVGIRLSTTHAPTLIYSDANGPGRRAFGYCCAR